MKKLFVVLFFVLVLGGVVVEGTISNGKDVVPYGHEDDGIGMGTPPYGQEDVDVDITPLGHEDDGIGMLEITLIFS